MSRRTLDRSSYPTRVVKPTLGLTLGLMPVLTLVLMLGQMLGQTRDWMPVPMRGRAKTVGWMLDSTRERARMRGETTRAGMQGRTQMRRRMRTRVRMRARTRMRGRVRMRARTRMRAPMPGLPRARMLENQPRQRHHAVAEAAQFRTPDGTEA